ncbi:MAG: VOC family protein [Candidatus Promineofilum sp.]|nr:VOC family protein [Promineifilum sp.]
MSDKPFRVIQIDHVEFFVPDQYEAAAWYQRTLGLEIVADYEKWASDGPLMIASQSAGTMLALFRGEPRGERPTAGFHRVAFRVDGEGFLDFLARLGQIHIVNRAGQKLTPDQVVDHQLSWSIYFHDPYGHLLEVTTYDYDAVADKLN